MSDTERLASKLLQCSMARWMITGSGGRIGSCLLERLGADALGLPRAELDVTSAAVTSAQVLAAAPSIVVNAAGYSAVDAAEHDQDAAFATNATAVAHLVAACAMLDAQLIQISSDLVFDGSSPRPYEPGDPTAPTTAYGRSKLAGERFALAGNAIVVRTGWVYGGRSGDFVDSMIKLAMLHEPVDVVDDQQGSPVFVGDLCDALIALGERALTPRVLHYANTGVASWFDLAQVVFAAAGADPDLVSPTASVDLAQPAPRPAYSVLSSASWVEAGLPEPRSWRPAVDAYVRARVATLRG